MLRSLLPFTFLLTTSLKKRRQKIDLIALFLLPLAFFCLPRGEYVSFLLSMISGICLVELHLILKHFYLHQAEQKTSGNKQPAGKIFLLLLSRAVILFLCLWALTLNQYIFTRFYFIALGGMAAFLAASLFLKNKAKLICDIITCFFFISSFPLLFLPSPVECIIALTVSVTIPYGLLHLRRDTLEDLGKKPYLLYYYCGAELISFLLLWFLPGLTAYLLPAASWALLYLIGSSLYDTARTLEEE